jgi:hypothetical protein
MAPDEPDDDEMDLIKAEFDSMVADLNLDQATPRTYLDDLDAIEDAEQKALYAIPRVRRGLKDSIRSTLATIRSWWERPDNDDSDGAIV